MKITRLDKAIDGYLLKPIRYDIAIIATILIIECLIEYFFIKNDLPLLKIVDRVTEISFISSLISATVALAGFMVAALTIFVTVKASLKVRGIEDAENAMQIIFSTDHYKEILRIFKDTIVELIILLIVIYLGWMCSANFSDIVLSRLIFASVFAITMSISRSLYILFQVLDLESYKKEE